MRDWRGEEFRVGVREVFQSLRKGGRDSGIEKEWRKRRWVKTIFVFRERERCRLGPFLLLICAF